MESHLHSMGRGRRVVGKVLIAIPTVMLVGSSIAKFAGVPAVVAPLAKLGFFGGRLTFIAFLELFSALAQKLDDALFLDGPRFRERLESPIRETSCIGCY